MDTNQHTDHIKVQGLIDVLLFFSMFGMLLYNIGFKRNEQNRNPGRRGRWRPGLIYLPVLLLRWVFVPHNTMNQNKSVPFKNENSDHRGHHHYHHVHHHHQSQNDFIQRVDSSSLMEDGGAVHVRLPDILHGQ